MAGQQSEMLQKLERMGNLESVVTEQRMRIEKLKTTYETLKAEHLQLQDVRISSSYLQLVPQSSHNIVLCWHLQGYIILFWPFLEWELIVGMIKRIHHFGARDILDYF